MRFVRSAKNGQPDDSFFGESNFKPCSSTYLSRPTSVPVSLARLMRGESAVRQGDSRLKTKKRFPSDTTETKVTVNGV